MAEATESPNEEVVELAKNTATFYKTLTDQGVPEMSAGPMAQEFNHRVLRKHFGQ